MAFSPQHCYRSGVIGCESRILLLITLLHNAGSWGQVVTVTCHHQAVCALEGSQESMKCFYQSNIKNVFWFSPKQKAKWRNEEHPEDLALDSDYAGRVSYTETTTYSSTLTIRDLRERDSGEYHLMLFTGTGKKYHRSTAVNLTVSALQVKMTPDLVKWNGETVFLTCSTSCSLTPEPYYVYWYKNGRYVKMTYGIKVPLVLSSADAGGYSCSVNGHQNIHSTAACVSREDCWSVKYPDRRVCVVEGSSVELPCTFLYPSNENVEDTFWYYDRTKEDPKDLSLEEQFAGRVEYVGDKERNCALRIRDLRKSDSGEYHFRFITTTEGGKFSGKPGVILIVTDVQVRRSSTPVPEGQTVTLICSTTCTLPYNPTYIWYRNGQPVTNKPTKHNKLFLESADSEDTRQYSCIIREESTVLKHITIGVAVCLAVILITGALWMWRRNSCSSKENRSSGNSGQHDTAHVYDTVPAVAMTSHLDPKVSSDDQNNIHYFSIHFVQSQEASSSPTSTRLHAKSSEEECVQYASVNFNRCTTATPPFAAEDLS